MPPGHLCCEVGKKALRSIDQRADCHVQEWAVAETRRKNFPEARRLFMKALALNPRHVPAIGGLAHAEFQAGELHCARNLYARALQVANPPSDILMAEGQWLLNAHGS